MELIEHFESSLANFILILRLMLETISAVCVLVGLIAVIAKISHRRNMNRTFPFSELRLLFGTWLALALEFQLGADIVSTTVAPTLEDLAKLAVIAIIRTFLNYFLTKELEAEKLLSGEQSIK